MARRARRTHNPAFKAKVALAAIKDEKTLAELAQQSMTFTPTRSRRGRLRCLTGPPGCSAAEAAPAVDLKVLHNKIGELTLENDILAGALSKAGLLSAKR